jgi:hypothetical protein
MKWRKLAALGTGALMLGATLTGALAAKDLGAWTSDFLTGGVLDNTVIVVGKVASTSDVLGAIDVAAALQAEAATPVSSGAVVVDPTITAGVKVEKSGDKFNYGEEIYDVLPENLDDTDLPTLLPEGTFKDTKGDNKGTETYKQQLQFKSTGDVGKFDLYQPKDEDAGDYVKFQKNKDVYTYTLDFSTAISYETSTSGAAQTDLEGNTLEVLGKKYTLSEVHTTSGLLDKLKLLGGDSTVWLVQDQPYTIGDHTVTVVDVDSGQTKCGINVDGVTSWVDVSSTEQFGELTVGVLSVIAVNTKDYDADTCELSLGSSELVLDDGQEIQINGDTVDGSTVAFSGTAGKWDGFTITYKLNVDEDLYLAKGDAWTDPVFGSWKVAYAGNSAVYEDMSLSVSGTDGTFTFVNSDGKEVEIPYFYDETNSRFMSGEDEDTPLLLPGDTFSADPEGALLLYVTTGGETHVLEITKVQCSSSSKNETTIYDRTYNSYPAKDEQLDTCGTAEDISLGSLGTLKLALSESAVTYDATYGDNVPKTLYEGTLAFTAPDGSAQYINNSKIFFKEKKGDETIQSNLTFVLSWDGTDKEININSVLLGGASPTWVDNSETDDDTQWAITPKGTRVEYDQKDDLWANVQYPEEDVYANVFISPLSATVVGGSSGSSGVVVNPFSVGFAVLDEDAESLTKNMVVVGGPCANMIAADLLGNPANCVADFEEGKAKLKYFDRKGMVALLVAGYDAQDTLGAAYVLSDYKKYSGLKGNDEVEVVVTSLDQISVSSV